jgi:hypothetical protein
MVVAKLTISSCLDVRRIAFYIFFKYDKNKKEKFALTRAQINTVHRAVKALTNRGTIKLSKKISDEGYPCWELTKPVADFEKIGRAAKKRRLSVVNPVA